MRQMRKSLLVLAILSLVVSLASCNSEKPSAGGKTDGAPATVATEHKNRRIVFIFKVDGLRYGEVCKEGAQRATGELHGVSVEYWAPEKAEVGKQIEYMQQLIAQKVDAIVLAPNDADAIVPAVKQAMDAGIKVFTWDSDAPKSERIFYVAAADDVQIGVDIADKLAKEIGEKGTVQIVSGGQGAANLNLHVQGFEKGFAKYPGIKLTKQPIYNEDDNVKARAMATYALQRDPDIAGFACANSPSPTAAGESITKLNKIGKVKVWGLGLPKENAQYLKSGAISGLMLWDPAKLTYLTARLVNDYLDGKQPEDGAEFKDIGRISVKNGIVLMPTLTITRENVDQFDF